MADLNAEISRRRTFAIISHPDAGKTTLTEKFLLYGGAINQAGVVKGKKNARAATSDWMEIEKQRGISVTSSVMQFQYEGFCINILDTPGPPGLLRGHLPHPDGRRQRRHGHRRGQGRGAPRPGSCSRCAPCGTSRSSPLSTRWTGTPGTPSSCARSWSGSWASPPAPSTGPSARARSSRGSMTLNHHKIIHFTSNTNAKAATATQVDLDDPRWWSSLARTGGTSWPTRWSCWRGAGGRIRHGGGPPRQAVPGVLRLRPDQLRAWSPSWRSFLRMTTAPLPRKAGDQVIDSFEEDFFRLRL